MSETVHPNPMRRAALQRNLVLDEIEENFQWAWLIDADEIYTDKEAVQLWEYFFKHFPWAQGVTVRTHTYWRSMRWKVLPPEPIQAMVIMRTSERLNLGRSFVHGSSLQGVPWEVCAFRHYSWAKEPWRVRRKISNWGHALEVSPGWYDNVFEAWTPGCDMEDLHVDERYKEAYKRIGRCEEPIPECLENHPWSDGRVIEDEKEREVFRVLIEGEEFGRLALRGLAGVELVTEGEADIALFDRIDSIDRYQRVRSMVPCVVRDGEESGLSHSENGFTFGNALYARHWVQMLSFNEGLRKKFVEAHQ